MPTPTPSPQFQPLTESQIQDRLYGEYHTGRRRSTQPRAPSPNAHTQAVLPPVEAPKNVVAPPTEPVWTGQEILTRELERLGTELSTLRRERESLATELTRRRASPATPRRWVVPRSWVTVGMLLVASAALAALCHTVVLEAQPPVLHGAPGTLYSVQVGVYDIKPSAERFLETLSREGYTAFLMEGTTRRGIHRYRVYVGRFASKVEAQVELDLLKLNPRLQDSFILQRRKASGS